VDAVAVPTPFFTPTFQASRPLAGIALHSTETDDPARCHAGGSWHYQVLRDGTVEAHVAEGDVAWGVRATDRWHPAWLPHSRPWEASAANCWCVSIELVSSQKWRQQGRPYTQAQYRALQALLLDLRARYGPLPVFGHGHVQSDRSDPVWFDWATVLPVLPETDAVMPLEGASRANPLLGGYGFAEKQGDGVWHPGVDLNAGAGGDADLGKPVRAPTDCVVRRVLPWDRLTTGFGNHVWLEATDGHWLHLAHLHAIACREGERLPRRALLGTCGKTGNWQWAHTHWEVTYAKPASWTQWPTGWSKDRVLDVYMDPFAYLAATWPGAAETGEDTPEMEEPVLNDAELEHEARAQVWREFYAEGTSDFAIPKRWKAELRSGRDLGSPLGPEEDLRSGGKMQVFQRGTIFARETEGGWKTSLVG